MTKCPLGFPSRGGCKVEIRLSGGYSEASQTDLPLIDGDPVGGGEPLVTLDVVDAVLEVAEALGQVHLEQVPQQVLQV